MSNYSNTKATIAANVYTNHNNEVAAAMVKAGINAVVDTLIAGGFLYKGVATTSTNPGSPDANVFYIATAPGTYTNFGSLVVNDGEVAILKYNGSWSKEVTGAATSAEVSALGQEVSDVVIHKIGGYVNSNNYITLNTSGNYYVACKRVIPGKKYFLFVPENKASWNNYLFTSDAAGQTSVGTYAPYSVGNNILTAPSGANFLWVQVYFNGTGDWNLYYLTDYDPLGEMAYASNKNVGILNLQSLINSGLVIEQGSVNSNNGNNLGSTQRVRSRNAVPTNDLFICVPDGYKISEVFYYSSWTDAYTFTFATYQEIGDTSLRFDNTYPYVRFTIRNDAGTTLTTKDFLDNLVLARDYVTLDTYANYMQSIGYKIQCYPGKYIVGLGRIYTDANGFLSDLIPTKKGFKYKYTGKTIYGSPVIFIIFDRDMKVLRFDATAGEYKDYPIEVTEDDAAWIRFGGYTDYALVENPYAVYDYPASFFGDFFNIANKNLFAIGVNKFNKDSTSNLGDKLIGGTTIVDLTDYIVSHPILVEKGVAYTWPFYSGLGNNKGLQYVKSDGTVIKSKTYTVTDGMAEFTPDVDTYIRVNLHNSILNSFMLCKQSEYPNQYESYRDALIEQYSLNKKQVAEVERIASRNVAQPNRLYGKILALDGDSICQGASQYGSVGGYGKIIAERNDMILENKSVGGGTIKNNTYSGETPRHWICESVSTLRADADYIIIEGGVNDGNTNKGAITTGYDGPFDKSTFCGGMEEICYVLNTRFAGKKVGFILVHRMTSAFSFEGDQDNLYWLAVKILEKWGIPYCDLNKECPPFEAFENSSVQALQDVAAAYVPDGWHPNTDGYEKYYCDKIEEWMQGL